MADHDSNSISAEGLLDKLSTQRFGRLVRVVREISSTIDLAWEWLRSGAPHGAVVIAERQTAGRGRRERKWASPSGGLWMSVIVRPDMPAALAGRLGIGTALAAAEALSDTTGCAVGVKWPNDLVLDDRKLGGVLVGTELQGERVSAAVLSLGVNANLSAADLPPEVRPHAATLREATRREHGLSEIAAAVLAQLEQTWPRILEEGDDLLGRWRALDVLAGKRVRVGLDGQAVEGIAQGIDRAGALVLAAADGKPGPLTAGEVLEVREAA